MAKKALKMAKSRARTSEGHYKADDPATPEKNEAFVEHIEVASKDNPDDNRLAQRKTGGRYLGGKLVE
tara:strand:- start:569 stop:772 length:204 start_codon:yes stop_codon:yes gene_type:complete